ncbi:class C beta-lactamase-related serine hydrolase [Nocardioides marmoriginsengisoli]|uniref:Class C beta-lactamase-related serine hydrolase n=1 Tax=Nocardioides marmoriginsengisoli TaxID=661483 RepID=A0A3N0CLN2_9ACTN|nr:serine hydrolase [Nocardioides marmoriginsengisoli]RNL64320.1 class C beta-lactamase-related serine hydrolase [Nocardioides marmoriginsengisoli]
MRRSRKIALTALAVVLVLLVGGYWYERPMLLTGTGYAAHNACALAAIADRGDPGDDLPPNPLVPVLKTRTSGTETTAGILGVLAKKHAWATSGYGCTLAEERPRFPAASTVSATGNPYAGATAPTPPAAVSAALERAFGEDLSASARKDLGTRGVVVLKDGDLVAERYADGFAATTPQLGWSMTKSVTSLLVGRLVAQGDVGLDDDHLRPEWKDRRAGITVRQLLQMTSGLHWDETYSLGTPITRMLYLEPDMGRYVASQELDHDPGTYLQYSSGSTTLLCSILAPKHGGADFPRRELFAPLGLASAVLEPDAVGTPVCSSYLWATPRDWASIGQFALQDGVWNGARLLPTGWMAETTKAVVVPKSEEEGYASGWWANQQADGSLVEPTLPADTYFAEGHDGQWLVVVPSHRLVIARLGFTPTEVDDRVVSTTAALIAALG